MEQSKFLKGLFLLLASASCAATATWTVVHGWSSSAMPHPSLGLYLASILLGLLALPLLQRKCPRERSAAKAIAPEMSPPPWAQASAAVYIYYATPNTGLTVSEVAQRITKYGNNELEYTASKSFWMAFVDEIYEPTQLLLVCIGILYAIFGNLDEAIMALLVVSLMVCAEVAIEWRAKQALAKLTANAPRWAKVLRQGETASIKREELVPGDIVMLNAGMEIPADLRLLSVSFLEVDEATLTGESAPVPKDSQSLLSADSSPLEAENMAFAGTMVTRGRGTGLVVATGKATLLGQLLRDVKKAKEPNTALQALLKEVAGLLALVAVASSAVGALLGFVAHQSWQMVLLTALSLMFATIPEELPILVAAVLAVGSLHLAKGNIFVKHLRAAENLAFVDTVLTDKTGTLTLNKLALKEVWLRSEESLKCQEVHAALRDEDKHGLKELLVAWLFMSDLGEGIQGLQMGKGKASKSSDPFDNAMLEAFQVDDTFLAHIVDIKEQSTLLDELPFDSTTKLSARAFRLPPGIGSNLLAPHTATDAWEFFKGSPEVLLSELDDAPRARALQKLQIRAAQGLRMIAYGSQPVADKGEGAWLRGAGMVGVLLFEDPLRREAPAAVRACQEAGLKVVVVSGDNTATAAAIARQAGILPDGGEAEASGRVVSASQLTALGVNDLADVSVVGRAAPVDKLQLLQALQAQGHCVLATGDGSNDAGLLAAADVSLAMGRGSDIARGAAGIVLLEDSFAGVVACVREGRRLLSNLRKAAAFYLAAKLALVLLVCIATACRRAPLRAIHIIVLELFMDLGVSTAFVAEPADPEGMKAPPRRKNQPFFDRPMLRGVLLGAGCMLSSTLGCFAWGWLFGGDDSIQTMVFLSWLLSHVLLAMNMRSLETPVFKKDVLENPIMAAWWLATFATVGAFGTLSSAQHMLHLSQLGPRSWAFLLAWSTLCTWWIEVAKLVRSWYKTTSRAIQEVQGGEGGKPDALRQPLLTDLVEST